MSREGITLIVLLTVAIVANIVMEYRMGALLGHPMIPAWAGATTVMFLVMGALWGAANTGIAIFWAYLRKSEPKPLAAFNFGLGLFLTLQVLGHVAYENWKATPHT